MTPAPGATATSSLPAWLPRGVRLSEADFSARHRVLLGLLLVQVPVLVVIGLLTDHRGPELWGQLLLLVLCAAAAVLLTGQTVRSCAMSVGLMFCADLLVHVGGGLTDLHIWFYVALVLVSLYQMWWPFLVAGGFVVVHHVGMSLLEPDAVFSDPVARAHPVPFALLHAFFLLAMAAALAATWRFTEDVIGARLADAEAADLERGEQLRLLHEAEAGAAEQAARQLQGEAERARWLAGEVRELERAGDGLAGEVATASAALDGLRDATDEIGRAAQRATTIAGHADLDSQRSAATVERLLATMIEIGQITTSISAIASQTDLLALNATIEAARAGEAGRGFAVVAGEVKDLATETAAATTRIRGVVDSVRADVDDAASSIGAVRGVMAEVVAAQATIAEAVHQQDAATCAVATSMGGAQTGAQQMAGKLGRLVDGGAAR